MAKACLIVNYNDSDRVINLSKQLYNYNFFDYIVIVDNDSNEKEKEKLMNNSENVSLIFSEINLGFSGANNLGLKWLKDKNIAYVYTINSDVFVEKSVLDYLSIFLENHCEIGVASCQMVEYNEKKQCFYDFPTIRHSIAENLGIIKLFNIQPHHVEKKENYILVDYIRSSLWCVRYDSFLEIGGFDEKTFLYHVETCVGLKMKNINKRFAIIPNLTYLHNHNYKPGYKIKGYKETYKSLVYLYKEYLHKNFIQISLYKFSYYIGFIIRKLLRIK